MATIVAVSTEAQTGPLTTGQVAVMLGHRDNSTVLKLVKAGRLTPVSKLPGRTGAHLFDIADVQAYMESRNQR
jgi:hypothetical protein